MVPRRRSISSGWAFYRDLLEHRRVEQLFAGLNILPANFTALYQRLLQTPLTENGRRAVVRELEGLTSEFELLKETGGHGN